MQPPSEANGPRSLSDEDVQRFRLDKVTPHNAPITLADYNPDWPVLFAREAAGIRAARFSPPTPEILPGTVALAGHHRSVSHHASFREPPFLRLIVRPRHLHSW